jgi:hypothetical protein
VLVFNLRGKSGAVARGVEPETGLSFASKMTGAVGGSQDFDVLVSRLRTLVEVVLDPGIGNLNAVIDEGKIKSLRNLLFDLVHIALRVGLARGVDGFLNLRF